MGKELNAVDTAIIEIAEVATQQDIIKLDDLSLILVGGGSATVVF